MRLLLLISGLLLVLPTFGEEASSPTVTVQRETIPIIHQFTGYIEAIHRATMKAETSGRIAEIYFDVDDIVEKGNVLARFGNKTQKAELDLAIAGEKEANAALSRDQLNFDRFSDLYEKKLVAKSALDQAIAALDASKARLEAAQAKIKQAKANYEYTIIRAPYSGIVTQRHVEKGEAVNPGSAIVSGISLDALRLVVDVSQNLVGAIRKNRQAMLFLEDGQIIKSEKLTIFPFADEASHTFRVRVDLPAGIDGLYPGMLVKAGFIADEKQVLAIPSRAIVKRGEMNAVYVQNDNGRIEMRLVRSGQVVANEKTVVEAGLDEGENVYLDPLMATVTLKQSSEKQ